MKKTLALFATVLAAVLNAATPSTSLVYKNTTTNALTGNIVVGNNTTISATGNGTITATALTGNISGNPTVSGNLTVSGGSIVNGAGTAVYYFGTPSNNYIYYDGSYLYTRVGGSNRLTISGSTGNVLIGTDTDVGAKVYSKVTDGTLSFGAAGTTKGIRFAHASTYSSIDGVDSSLSGSYQPLQINGSTVQIATSGGTVAASFDSSQNATFAGSVRPEATPSSKWGIDFAASGASGALVTIANDGTYDLAVGSGMVFLWDDGGSGVSQIATYYGITAIVWQSGANLYSTTVDTANKVNVYYNAGTNKYRIQNKFGSTVSIYVSTLKLRGGS